MTVQNEKLKIVYAVFEISQNKSDDFRILKKILWKIEHNLKI